MKRELKWGAGFIIALLPLLMCSVYLPVSWARGALLGAVVSILINVAEFLFLRKAIAGAFKKFLGILIGGFGFRMVVLLGSAFLVKGYLTCSLPWYLISFLIYFLAFQGWEIYYFNKQITRVRTI